MRRSAIALVAIGASSLAQGARAAPVSRFPVDVDIDPCAAIESVRVANLLGLELQLIDRSAADRAQLQAMLVRVGCIGPSLALRVASDDDGSEGVVSSEQIVSPFDFPAAGRPRMVAMVLAQMLARRWRLKVDPTPEPPPIKIADLVTRPKPTTEIEAPAPEPASDPVPPPPVPRTMLSLLGSWQNLGQPRRDGFGLALQDDWHPRHWLTIEGGMEGAQVTFEPLPGRVLATTASGVLAVGFGFTGHNIAASLGPGVRGGWAWLQGQSTFPDVENSTIKHPWWGPCAVANLSVRLWSRLWWSVRAEGGRFAFTVTGDRGPASTMNIDYAALAGNWLRVGSGISWALN